MSPYSAVNSLQIRTREVNSQERHQPRNEALSGPIHNFQKRSHKRSANGESNSPALYRIRDKQSRRHLVESMFLFQDKCAIDRDGEVGEG